MSNEILVALIALLGVMISVIVSVYIGSRATNTEIQKLKAEIQQSYADKLLEKRLESYPEMYAILSEFSKKYYVKKYTKRDLTSLLKRANDWNTNHSILFSGQTTLVSVRFRKLLIKLVENNDMSKESLHKFIRTLAEFEVALKSDIGIYVVDFSDPSKRFERYKDVEQKLQNSVNQKE